MSASCFSVFCYTLVFGSINKKLRVAVSRCELYVIVNDAVHTMLQCAVCMACGSD